MKCSDNMWRPVAFISKSLSNIEHNYEIHDKEMLAVIRYLEEWRHFLEGAVIRFEIWTNHKNLKYFIKVQKLNWRQVRQALYLLRFDFTLKHVPESKMGKADSLSRRPDQEIGIEKDNKNKMLVKPEQLEVKRTKAIEIIIDRIDLLEDVRVANSKARIKPTVPLSVFDKENSMEFSLNSLLLIYFTTVAMCLLSYGPHVTLVM